MKNLDAILFEFGDIDGPPTAARLRDYLARFPEYAAEISEFAAELAFADDDVASEADPSVVKSLTLRGKSNYLNQTGEPQTPVPNPFEKLTLPAVSELCTNIGVNKIFLAMVRNRAIEPDDFPPAFTAKLAKELDAPEAAVLDFLSAGPTLHMNARYRSDTKPHAQARVSFDAAAKQAGLTPEQIAALKKP